jgi:hypothetical protein
MLREHLANIWLFQIISTFPKQWFTALTEDKTMTQLENLCRYLVSIVNVIHNQAQDTFQRIEAKYVHLDNSVLTMSIGPWTQDQ